MARWISLYWAWLLPALMMLATLARLRAFHHARRRGLVRPRGWRWLLIALVASQVVIWLSQLALVYQANPWLPGGGLMAVGVMLVALRAASPEVHPGLRGFQRPLPRDGLELIESERRARRPTALRDALFLLPALSLLLYLAVYHNARWLDFVLLGMVASAPLGLIPYRHHRVTPMWLAPPLVLLLSQSLSLRADLPPGRWSTPVGGARCTGQVRVILPQARAWCLNALTGALYGFDLQTGVVSVEKHIPDGVRVLAANAAEAWVQQSPMRGLVRVTAEGLEVIPAHNARQGVADPEGRLWMVDVGMELSLFADDQQTVLRSRDGLLNNTANVVKVSPAGEVWVGSIGGVSVLRAGGWQTYSREQGVPGAVINFSFAGDGSVWLVWQARPGYGALYDWGVSQLAETGSLRRIDLGPATGLEAPRLEDALAVDGQGRLWFATQSIPRREKYLGIVEPAPNARVQLYSLGRFATAGPYAYGVSSLWQSSFGVVADGQGGILLFNGDAEPWRHWRP